MFLEERVVFVPARYPVGDWNVQALPLPVEDVWFEAPDGTRLNGWYAAHPNPRAVVLFCHGNGGNVTFCWNDLISLYREVRASVLMFDYRGYGRSEGKPSEAGVLSDARAARAWLALRAGVAEQTIVIMGQSLGGGVAVDLAAYDGARALVLEKTFSSVPDVAATRLPWLPVRWMMRTRFDSQAKIGDYHGPLFQSHGTADTVVPYRFGQKLFEAANEPKQFFSIPRGEHNEPMPAGYYRALSAFLDKVDVAAGLASEGPSS